MTLSPTSELAELIVEAPGAFTFWEVQTELLFSYKTILDLPRLIPAPSANPSLQGQSLPMLHSNPS